ncbi:hypothetical protein [Winogradskyella immobilis]|uniref:Uncharacterized protein n=1 Tax=Winogradskyella immobilis TaxID=2816852 RepID=A0ABS8EQW5_9FLAO|nr:hypothetical protein [Winogradskyella immobilis]MCC1485387.1 hypothetical protein [Winogradskyella immobilis]MCG0017479.1 hypothetical protein [Winogradskyella immobilis]
MKKTLNISLIIFGIGSLILIGFIMFIGAAMGKKADNYNFSEKQNLETKLIIKDSIPQGEFTYELYFTEFGGRMENLSVEIIITGNKIIVYNKEENPLIGGNVIVKGILLKHKSGKWIIGKAKTDKNAEEIGGCSDGPTPINFETKIIQWC